MLFFSELLKAKYPLIFSQIEKILSKYNIEYKLLPNTKDIWCRDYMPVRRADMNGYVQFVYEPSYLVGYEDIRTVPQDVVEHIGINRVEKCDIKLDGGNIVQLASTAIMTERVYRENPNLTHRQIYQTITNVLGLKKLTIVPDEDCELDMTGHIDGICRFIDSKRVLLDSFFPNDKLYEKRVKKRLKDAGFEIIQIEITDSFYDHAEWAPYINYIETDKLIIVPTFGHEEADKSAVKQIRQIFHNKNIESVYVKDLIDKGGALNCVSWEI